MKKIKENLCDSALSKRILMCLFVFFVLFFSTCIMSYFLLPDGFLRNSQTATFDVSKNILTSSLQIFLWNMISFTFIFIGSLFGKKSKLEKEYLSVGYSVFFILIFINAVTLGTWSFSVDVEAVSLIDRIIGIFNIAQNGGLLEMLGFLFIVCALAKINIIQTEGKKVKTKKVSEVKLNKEEIIALVIGFILIYSGALIESISIISHA